MKHILTTLISLSFFACSAPVSTPKPTSKADGGETVEVSRDVPDRANNLGSNDPVKSPDYQPSEPVENIAPVDKVVCNHSETESRVDIALSTVSKFEIDCSYNEYFEKELPELSGQFDVKITNRSCHDIIVAHMDPANFRFVRNNSKSSFSFFHKCAPGFLLSPWDKIDAEQNDSKMASHDGDWSLNGGEVVFLESGQTKSFQNESWACEGGPYGPTLRPGRYKVTYHLHEIEPFRTFGTQKIVSGSLKKMVASLRNTLNSGSFWKGSHKSNTVEITIPSRKCKKKR